MSGYVAFWKGKRAEVYADTIYKAKQQAAAEFVKTAGRKKVKPEDIVVILAETDGVPVVHTPDF
jgi:hypothetical protein